MSQPFVGQLKIFAGNFAPKDWMFCEGQLLAISENETLFQLIGTTYGGDGQETFALPDLRGRLPVHRGTGAGGVTVDLGEQAGTETVTLTTLQIPNHRHLAAGNQGGGNTPTPVGNIWSYDPGGDNAAYRMLDPNEQPNATMAAAAIAPLGGSQPHTNVQPFLCVNFIISLFGIFPNQG
jgi:microcystin-dependent protein